LTMVFTEFPPNRLFKNDAAPRQNPPFLIATQFDGYGQSLTIRARTIGA
jgi:hypothetical protein